MDFGMPTLIENKNLEETVSLCRELGLQFIELNMNFPMYQVPQLEETGYLRELARQNNIYFTIHLDENLNVCDFNRLVADAYMETVERALKVAEEINAPLLNMHMNHGIYITLPDRKVRLFGEYQEEYMSSFRRFREMCERVVKDAGVKICIENTDGYQSYEKEAIVAAGFRGMALNGTEAYIIASVNIFSIYKGSKLLPNSFIIRIVSELKWSG